MAAEIYFWLPFLLLVFGLFIGLGLLLFPKDKRSKDLEYNLREELEDWHKTKAHQT